MKKQAPKKPAPRLATKPAKSLKHKKVERKAKARTHKAPAPPQKSAEVLERERRTAQALEQYESAVRFLHQQKFEKAKALFEKVLAGPLPELADRARVHLNTCRVRIEGQNLNAKGPEEHYNVAVALINVGRLDEAHEHLSKVLKVEPKADYAYYALAAIYSLRGDIEGGLSNLKTAIDLDPRNRYLVRSDSDFTALAEDPRFADLVYPEKNGF